MISEVDVKDFMDAVGHLDGSEEVARLYADLVAEEYDELVSATAIGDRVEVLDGLIDTIWCLMGYGIALGYNMTGAWKEVYASNMSKIGEDGTVEYDDNGKVMKPKGYFKPDLTKFV